MVVAATTTTTRDNTTCHFSPPYVIDLYLFKRGNVEAS
jgi:hypothetical protein